MGDGRYGGGLMEGGCILYYIRFIAWLLGLHNQPHKTRIPYAGMKTFYSRVLDIRFAILDSEDQIQRMARYGDTTTALIPP
jgi:hypothetical protein